MVQFNELGPVPPRHGQTDELLWSWHRDLFPLLGYGRSASVVKWRRPERAAPLGHLRRRPFCGDASQNPRPTKIRTVATPG